MWKNRAMDKTVVNLNVEHYRKLLAAETDGVRCETLRRLLVEEETKLTALMDMPDSRKLKH
jgi:hypothetical protein